MITIATPLEEVALHMPTESAALLCKLEPHIQMHVLTDMRLVLAGWESRGVDLDPITFSAVVVPVVQALVIDNLALYVEASKRDADVP